MPTKQRPPQRGKGLEARRSLMKQAGAQAREDQHYAATSTEKNGRLQEKLAKERATAMLTKQAARAQAAATEEEDADAAEAADSGAGAPQVEGADLTRVLSEAKRTNSLGLGTSVISVAPSFYQEVGSGLIVSDKQ